MEHPGFQWIMKGNSDHMGRRARMSQPDMASLLTDHTVTEALQCTDEPVSG